jgi:hypothetical protein
MAVAKKASTEKAAPKKVAAKTTAAKKLVKSTSLVIKVPQGGQVIRTFYLTPSLPVDGQAGNWLLVDPRKPTQDIDSMRFSFSVDSSSLEQQFERAIIQIKIQQNPDNNGIWRFASDGVAVNPIFNDVNHDVVVEITDAGYTLLAQVQSIGNDPEEIHFGYLASFTDGVSGAVNTYESLDPDVKVGRP